VDSTAASEKDTGFDLPVGAMVSPHLGISVIGAQAKTIDFGILASETGDADGFGVAVDMTTAGSVLVKSASTATRGALVGGGTLDRGHTMVSGKPSRSATPCSPAPPRPTVCW
jgi:hypothetical protein